MKQKKSILIKFKDGLTNIADRQEQREHRECVHLVEHWLALNTRGIRLKDKNNLIFSYNDILEIIELLETQYETRN